MRNWHLLIRVRGQPTRYGVRWPVACVIEVPQELQADIDVALVRKYGPMAPLPASLAWNNGGLRTGGHDRPYGYLIERYVAITWWGDVLNSWILEG